MEPPGAHQHRRQGTTCAAMVALARPLYCDSGVTLFRQRRGCNGPVMLGRAEEVIVAAGTVMVIVGGALLCAALALALAMLAAVASLVELLPARMQRRSGPSGSSQHANAPERT